MTAGCLCLSVSLYRLLYSRASFSPHGLSLHGSLDGCWFPCDWNLNNRWKPGLRNPRLSLLLYSICQNKSHVQCRFTVWKDRPALLVREWHMHTRMRVILLALSANKSTSLPSGHKKASHHFQILVNSSEVAQSFIHTQNFLISIDIYFFLNLFLKTVFKLNQQI